jgi:hypothetical protein
MASVAASYATKYATKYASDEINRGTQTAKADLDKVKGDTINALKQLQGSVINSLTETETYALMQCLNRCKTAAKDMIAAHDASLQLSPQGGKKGRRKTNKRKNKKNYRKTRRH